MHPLLLSTLLLCGAAVLSTDAATIHTLNDKAQYDAFLQGNKAAFVLFYNGKEKTDDVVQFKERVEKFLQGFFRPDLTFASLDWGASGENENIFRRLGSPSNVNTVIHFFGDSNKGTPKKDVRFWNDQTRKDIMDWMWDLTYQKKKKYNVIVERAPANQRA